MARLFVSFGQPGNEQVIRDALSEHQIILANGVSLPDASFDLAILDMASFLRLRESLNHHRQASSPSLVPVMLLLQQDQAVRVQKLLGTEIHDILVSPSSRVELSARISNLLKLQELSGGKPEPLDPSESSQMRTDRTYQVLAACNEAVLRGENETQLFQSVLDTLVQLSDYSLAWIGRARHDKQRNLEVLAWSGNTPDYIRDLQVRWQEDRYSQGPGGRAVKSRTPVVCQDVDVDQSFLPWRRLAQDHGIRSSAAIPLDFGDNEMGLLAIYSTRAQIFTEDEISLLERLAANIAYGVETLRMRRHLQEQHTLAWNSAYRDTLTGLPNRQWIMEELNRLEEEFEQHNGIAALLFIDLDGFKRINDTLGHEVGDHLLHDVSQRLNRVAGTEDLVARLGGDEFIMLMRFDASDDVIANAANPHAACADAAARQAERLIDALRTPFHDGALEHHLSASVGISLYPADTTRASALINCADIAMYEAKASGSGHYRFYYAELAVRNQQKLILKNNLHRAVDANAFSAYYQPIIDIHTGKVAYVEALMRLVHSDGTVTTPGHFLQTLEETGLISRSGQMLLEQVGQTLAAYRPLFPELRLAVNLSLNQLWQADLIDQLEGMLERYNLPASALMLEVTEEFLMTDILKAEQFLAELHGRGFEIAIDDFGTGYSSLDRLRSLPVNKLKIDKSFLERVPQDRESVEMFKAILQMANSLDLEVVAEGVETVAQLQAIADSGCLLGQGFLFAHPMSADDLQAYLSLPSQGWQQPA